MTAKRADEQAVYAIPASCRVKDLPEGSRPREMADRVGIANLGDAALLAIILRSGTKGMSVVDVASLLLSEYGSLTALAQVSEDDLARMRGVGRVKAQVLKSAFELAKRLAQEGQGSQPVICAPEEAADVLREHARAREEEVFWALLLDTRNRLKRGPVELTRGLLDASLVHPREVFREAVRSSCAAIVLAHNHPSGDPTPSAEDIKVTRQIVEAGRVLNIGVLDHVILGRRTPDRDTDFFSLREAGLVKFEE